MGENAKLVDVAFRWLLHEKGINMAEERKESDLSEYTRIPNTSTLADNVRSCLQENEELPKDFQKLFNDTLFKFDTDLIPEAVALYSQLGVKHDPLSLIPPQFESPLPPLNPAVFPPALRELPPPALDPFDLDYYVEQSGEIMGVTSHVGTRPKEILHFIFKE